MIDPIGEGMRPNTWASVGVDSAIGASCETLIVDADFALLHMLDAAQRFGRCDHFFDRRIFFMDDAINDLTNVRNAREAPPGRTRRKPIPTLSTRPSLNISISISPRPDIRAHRAQRNNVIRGTILRSRASSEVVYHEAGLRAERSGRAYGLPGSTLSCRVLHGRPFDFEFAAQLF
jgi:hypothetical protein